MLVDKLMLDSFATASCLLIVIAFVIKRMWAVYNKKCAGRAHPAKKIKAGEYRLRYWSEVGWNKTDNRYEFKIKERIDGYRIYILRSPSYGKQLTDCQSTHRYISGKKYYICWSTPIVRLCDAEAIARTWAEYTQNYIQTGQRFG